MRHLSPHSLALLRAAENASLAPAALGEALLKLSATREPAVLPQLLPFVLHAEAVVARAARRAVLRLLRVTPARELGWLDQTQRAGWRLASKSPGGVLALHSWYRLQPSELPTLAPVSKEPETVAVLLLASLHASGYVRQAAVQLLAELPFRIVTGDSADSTDGADEAVELPFLLLRLNDWVAPVQQAALAALKQRLVAAYAPQLVRCIYLVEQLQSYRRRDHEQVLAALREFLSSAACRPALLAGLTAADRVVQRLSFARLLETRDVAARTVVLAGLDSSDTVVRVWAARAGRRRLYGRDLAQALGQARRDRAVPVRMEAVYAFINDHPELQALLLDPCKSIRETVRFYIRKHATIDFAALYRAALADASPARLPTVVLSLGETGGPSDAAYLASYAAHPQLRVRKAALHALGQLDPQSAAPILYAALLDPHPGVARTAWEALRARPEVLTPDQLRVWLSLRPQYE